MYNKQHNTRNSGRFNNPGQFVPAAETMQQQPQQTFPGTPRPQRQMNQIKKPQQQNQQQNQQQQQQQQHQQQSNLQEITPLQDDVEMKTEAPDVDDSTMTSKNEERPAWMKSKLGGVKKISNKERRRRQNESLRRLLTPKNALMVLNEMIPHEQVNNQFKVEAMPQTQYFTQNPRSFCADLTLEGSNYKGYGDNKLSARNSAAEQAIRDLIIKKLNKMVTSEGEEALDEETLPMIQLTSFALHKLFTEWECDGFKVPQLRANSVSEAASVTSDGQTPAEPRAKKPKAPSKPHTLPLNAGTMHPCMLLTYMKPRLEYQELAVEGDKPQNMMFTMGVNVDGSTYIGKAANKREARRSAARAACAALFDVQFEEGAAAATPILQ